MKNFIKWSSTTLLCVHAYAFVASININRIHRIEIHISVYSLSIELSYESKLVLRIHWWTKKNESLVNQKWYTLWNGKLCCNVHRQTKLWGLNLTVLRDIRAMLRRMNTYNVWNRQVLLCACMPYREWYGSLKSVQKWRDFSNLKW